MGDLLLSGGVNRRGGRSKVIARLRPRCLLSKARMCASCHYRPGKGSLGNLHWPLTVASRKRGGEDPGEEAREDLEPISSRLTSPGRLAGANRRPPAAAHSTGPPAAPWHFVHGMASAVDNY
jgi:hypothetical protein